MNYEVTLLTIGFENSHDIKFAKQLSENYSIPFVDLAKAKIPDKNFKIIK